MVYQCLFMVIRYNGQSCNNFSDYTPSPIVPVITLIFRVQSKHHAESSIVQLADCLCHWTRRRVHMQAPGGGPSRPENRGSGVRKLGPAQDTWVPVPGGGVRPEDICFVPLGFSKENGGVQASGHLDANPSPPFQGEPKERGTQGPLEWESSPSTPPPGARPWESGGAQPRRVRPHPRHSSDPPDPVAQGRARGHQQREPRDTGRGQVLS